MARTKKAKNTNIAYDIKELQTWLSGIMEFQDDNWSPSKEQWEVIYEKLMNLSDKKVDFELSEKSINQIASKIEDKVADIIERTLLEKLPAMPQQATQQHAPRTPPQMNQGNRPQQPLIEEDSNQHPQEFSMELEQPPQLLSPEEIQRMVEEKKKGANPVSATGKVAKTPNIDTSKEGYKSGFV